MQRTSTEPAAVPVSRRRSSLETYCDILYELSRARNRVLRETGIVYKCNLTWKSVKPFLERLRIKGMVEVISAKGYTGRAYHLTQEGYLFLQFYQISMRKLSDEPYDQAIEGIWP